MGRSRIDAEHHGRQRGQTMAEYAIILSVIIIGVAVAVTLLGSSLAASIQQTAVFIAGLG